MLIGLIGLAGAGKTTVADYLVDNYGYKKLSFKYALIDELKENFPELLKLWSYQYDMEDIDGLFKVKPEEVRLLMQHYGTEVRRRDDPDYWVNKWHQQFSIHDTGNIVVDDVRFLNEADRIKMCGGKLIRLEREDLVPGKHVSEQEQFKIEHDIAFKVGAGEHAELYRMVDLYLEEHAK